MNETETLCVKCKETESVFKGNNNWLTSDSFGGVNWAEVADWEFEAKMNRLGVEVKS